MQNSLQPTSNTQKQTSLRLLVKVAILASVASVLMYFEFPLFFAPPFLKMDLSDLPALIAAFSFGPFWGAVTELIKNLLHFVIKGTTTGGVGELANFVVGAALVVPAGWLYRRSKSRRGAVMGMVAGSIAMAAVAALANYFVLIPFYVNVMKMPLAAIISMSSKVNSLVSNLPTLIAFAVVPFNLVKATVVSILTLLIYKRLSPLLHELGKNT